MTHKQGNTIVIKQTAPAECQMCRRIRELRPYGPWGSWVCFECGMKDEENAIKQIEKLFNGERDI